MTSKRPAVRRLPSRWLPSCAPSALCAACCGGARFARPSRASLQHRPRPAHDRWRRPCRARRGRRRRRPGAPQPARSAADGRGAARHRAASGSACNPRTCTSARRDAACGSRRPSPARAVRWNAARLSRLHQRVVVIGLGRIDVAVGRHDVVVAGQHHRHAGRVELGGMRGEPLDPGELVVEFRPGLRVAVRRVERGDRARRSPPPRCSGSGVGRIAGQLVARHDRLAAAREDRDAVPGFLPAPDRAVAGLLDRRVRETPRPPPSAPAGRRRRAWPPPASRADSASRLLMLLMLKVAIFILALRNRSI